MSGRAFVSLWHNLFNGKARGQADKAEKARRNSSAFREMHRESLHRLTSAPRKSTIAMVGVAPPTHSGIAFFNQAVLSGLAAELDFFGDFSELDHVRRVAKGAAAAPARVRVFSACVFRDAVRMNRYRVAIFVLGNSDHNLFAWRAARIAQGYRVENILLYLHDAFLYNLYLASIGVNPHRFRKEMRIAYGGRSGAEKALDELGWPPHPRQFYKNGWLTLRPLLQRQRVSGIIVNSVAARELIVKELEGVLRRDAIHMLFHPILGCPLRTSAKKREKRGLRIGTFGIPDRAKRTDAVLAAWRWIKAAAIPEAELILAGYYASIYAAENALDRNERGLEVIDSPSDEELLDLMASVDVAVQLRLEERGESSGAVHQLLGLHRRVIVSAHGSYKELGDAVMQIPPGASEAEIAAAILTTSADEQLGKRAAGYAATHSLQRYQYAFCALVDDLRS